MSALRDLIGRRDTLFVDGGWQAASDESRLVVTDPSDETVIAEIPASGAGDIARAAQAAARAWGDWKARPSAERAGYLRGFAEGLRARRAALVELQMRNNGKPRVEAEIDLDDAAATFDYYAGLAEGIDAAQDAPVVHAGGLHRGRVRHEPLGPVGLIVPWNFPLVTSAWKIAPALAAGCTAVLKLSEATPLAELVYGDISIEIDLPPGVLNIAAGGAEAGVAVTTAPELRKVSFTGSNMIGAQVMAALAPRCLPLSLELGGKSAIVVFDDADIERAVDCIIGGIFFNAGQICSATSRLIMERDIAPRLTEALVERTRTLQVGGPFEDNTEMGPITTEAQFERLRETLARARMAGLEALVGGDALDREGRFIAPTIFRDVPHADPVWTEELFGPVLATATVANTEEAVALANATRFGLVGSVVGGDPERADAVADQLEAGQVWVNTPQVVYPDSAWGGFKQSGIGRELGPWGLAAYQGVKHILSES
ncbi:aldehyde dehydrogenase family protein [Limimaricola soesokkakensis]|uniref:aldehyde dehydrogenase family protein n=1 Tax=Limimaricola soesokkakensis TaxID=1343159 RepID=UPI00351603E1